MLRLPAMDLSADTVAGDWGQETMAQLQPDSIAVTRRDGHTFCLAYLQTVLGVRPDVTLVDADLLVYDWYRGQLAAGRPGLTPADTVEELARRNPGRAVVEVSESGSGPAPLSTLRPKPRPAGGG